MQSPLAVTAVVQPHPMRKTSLQRFNLKDIGQKFRKLMDMSTDMRRTFRIGRIFQMLLDVQHTTTGRRDDMVAIPELTREIPVATLPGRSKPAVGHRLSATGLIRREMYGAAMLFQQLQRSNPYLRIELVNVTGNEQSHFHDCKLAVRYQRDNP